MLVIIKLFDASQEDVMANTKYSLVLQISREGFLSEYFSKIALATFEISKSQGCECSSCERGTEESMESPAKHHTWKY